VSDVDNPAPAPGGDLFAAPGHPGAADRRPGGGRIDGPDGIGGRQRQRTVDDGKAPAGQVVQGPAVQVQAPPAIARLRFPAYYIDVIQPAAAERAVDPLLMLSLIRQESLFNTYATAGAGEKGLTQVIPSTAEYIARKLNWPDYQHADLFRPYAGIAFGADYLYEQLELFDRNAVVALAAYNAGPGRAYDWNALSGGDPDLFMTTITIDSTRHYVQFIYRNYNIYRELYGVDDG